MIIATFLKKLLLLTVCVVFLVSSIVTPSYAENNTLRAPAFAATTAKLNNAMATALSNIEGGLRLTHVYPDGSKGEALSVAHLAYEYEMIHKQSPDNTYTITIVSEADGVLAKMDIPVSKHENKAILRDYLLARIYNIVVVTGSSAVMDIYVPNEIEGVIKSIKKDLFSKKNSYIHVLDIITRSYGQSLEINIHDIKDVPLAAKNKESLDKATLKETNTVALEKYLLDITKVKGLAIGIDIGGTDVKLALIDSDFPNKTEILKHTWAVQPKNFKDGKQFYEVIEVLLVFALAVTSLNKSQEPGLDGLKARAKESFDSDKTTVGIMNNIIGLIKDHIKIIAPSSIGISFPDIIIENSIKGGMTSKTKSMRARYTDGNDILTQEYWDDFNENIMPLANKVSMGISKYFNITEPVPTAIINDGAIGSLWAATILKKGSILNFASGTSLGGRILGIDCKRGARISNYSYGIVFIGDKNYKKWEHNELKIPGSGQQLFSQDTVFTLALARGIIEKLPVKGNEKIALEEIQKRASEEEVKKLFKDIGEYLALIMVTVYYGSLKDTFDEVVLFGRVIEGVTGEETLSRTNKILNEEFKELGDIKIRRASDVARDVGMPDEQLDKVDSVAQAIGTVFLGNAARLDAEKSSSSGKNSIAVKKLLNQLKDEDMLGQMRFVAGLDEVLTPAEMAGYRAAYSNNKFLDIGFDYKKDKKTDQITTYLNRLGWTTDAIARVLDNPKVLADIIIKAAEIRERYDYVIFCGMGGSRLCIDTVRGVFGEPKDIKMFTLGTTDSSTIDDIVTAISEDAGSLQEALKKTLVVAISKSATTKETLSHKQYFEDLFISSELFGENPLNPDDHLLFITDKDAALYKQATPENRQDRMMLIQLDQKTDMGGRYTAPATTIPLLPLAIIAGDKAPELITTILKKAFEMNDISDINKDRFIELGAFLYYMAAIEHKDKLTLILPEDLKALAPWSEQLFEESLGKHIEKGITIIYNEDISSDNIKSLPENDRVFLRFKFLDQTDSQEGFWKHLVENGYPVRQIEVDDIASLGGIELGLQRAVATIGYLWDINFVDQPAVDGYKKATNEVMDALAPNAHVTIPFTTEAKYQSLKLYWRPLVDAGAINEEQLRAEVKELGSDITDAPAVYAAIIRLLIENQGFEVAELAPWANMTSSFEKVMKQVRYDIFTAGLKMPSKLAIHPDGNHSFQQNVEGGRNIFFSTYMLGMKMRQPKVQEYEPELLKAQAIGTVNSLVDSNRKVVLLVTDNELVLEERVVEGFFDKVEQYLAKTSSSGESRLAPEKRLAIEAQFNDLLEFTEESDIEGAIKRPIVKFDLTRDDFLSFDFAMILEHFRQLARDKLGENIIMDILPNMNGHEGVRVGISMQSYSVMVANKTSSSGILLTDNDLVFIELAAEIADLSDATGTIVYNDTTIPTEQQRILWSLLGKGTQGLADLEVKLGCNVRLMSQGDVSDDVNTIIISTEQLPGFYNAKYLITKQAQIDTSYIAIVPLIGIAKGLLGFESRTSQPELYEALKSSIRRLSKGQLNDSAIEAAITAYINDKLISIMLPLPTSYDYEKLEQLYRQALMVLIAA